MIEILTVTFPFFALVGCGWLAARRGLLPAQAVPSLNAFVLWFALPAMLLRFAAGAPFSSLADLPAMGAYASAGLLVLAATVAALRLGARDGWRDAALGAMSASWSNWGYMGFALLPALLGPQALAPLIAAGVADLVVVVSTALAIASREGRGDEHWLRAVGGALAGVARNPLIWAIGAGTLLSALQASLPGPVDRLLALLGNAAGPVALFAMGAALWSPQRVPLRSDTLTIVAAKLVLHPLAAWVAARHVFGLPHEVAAVLTLAAALPAAGTVFLFAERAGANATRSAAVILISTVAAFPTFALIAAMLASR